MTTDDDKATPRPWKESGRNWRGEDDPHSRYIRGGCYEEPDEDDDGVTVTVCTGVAVVLGNATAGDIPAANARLIVRAVNAFDALAAALKEALVAMDEAYTATGHLKVAETSEQRQRLLAALKLAETP